MTEKISLVYPFQYSGIYGSCSGSIHVLLSSPEKIFHQEVNNSTIHFYVYKKISTMEIIVSHKILEIKIVYVV